MGRKLTPYDLAILRASLPLDLSLNAVPPKVLGAAMVAWGNDPKGKICGRGKLHEAAVVYVETETGGELISFWNSYMKELPFVPTELARHAAQEFRLKYRTTWQRWGDVMSWLYFQCIMAPFIFSGPLSDAWSFLYSEWGLGMTLCFVLVPMTIIAFVLEHVYDQITFGMARVRNRDQYLVKKYLREIDSSASKTSGGWLSRLLRRRKK